MTANVGAQANAMTQAKEIVSAKTAVASSRMAFIDNIRILLTVMVILVHLAITYGSTGSWFYAERPSTELAGILLSLYSAFSQFFFMGLFFLISGYFVPGSVDRKGLLKYTKDRLVRLGIPLVLFSLLVSPFTEYAKSMTVYHDNTRDIVTYTIDYWASRNYAPGPLWFVEVLLVFSLAYILGRALLSLGKRTSAKADPAATKRPLTNAWIAAFILVCAPLNFIVRLASPIGEEWEHLQMAFMPQYILMVAAGILAYRNGWLTDLPAGVRKLWSAIAIPAALALPVVMVASGVTDGNNAVLGGLNAWSALLSIWEPVFCISISIALISLFQRRFNRQGAIARVMSQNSYAVYIIHPMIIIPGAFLLRNIALDPLLKWTLFSPLLIAACFMASHWLVRRLPYSENVL